MTETRNLRKTRVYEKDQQLIEKKLTRLDKFFSDDAVCTVKVDRVKETMVVEITVIDKGMTFRAERSDKSVTACVDEVIDIITRQIRKNKTRLEKKLRENAFNAFNFESADDVLEEEFKIVKTKKYKLKTNKKCSIKVKIKL